MSHHADDFEIMPSGVPNLDTILGGGIPVGSFNLIAGGPGTGKTILSQQMMYHNATAQRQALHFTVLGEPVAKLLRYQSLMSFFDPAKINTSIRYIDIGDVIRKEGLERGLELMISRVERYAPAIVIVDSVRAVREISRREGEYGFRTFTHDLAQVAVVWNTTTFMVGEYEQDDLKAGPEFTMADGIIWMEMAHAENSVMRKLEVVKSRGMAVVSGLHAFRIDRDGIYIYPRLAPSLSEPKERGEGRAAFGVPGLDRMLGGGIPRQQTCLISGASGTGKSILAQHFLVEGIRLGERVVFVTFEESPTEYAKRAKEMGWDLDLWEQEGKLTYVYRRPLDLSVDEVIDDVRRQVERIGAKRLIIDSLSGFELARARADLSNFREAVYRLVSWVTAQGVTVVMTTEVVEEFGVLTFSTYEISFLADNIILQRFIELESELRRLVTVVKMRSSSHGNELRQYEITDKGMVVGAPFRQYAGLLSGAPTLIAIMGPQPFAPGLEARESALVHALFGLGEATGEEIQAETRFAEEEVERMLGDLVAKGYVVKEQKDGQTLYHVSMVTWMPSVRRPQPPGGASRGEGGPGRVQG